MIEIKSRETLCDHAQYCTHRKYDKCPVETERLISHVFPVKNTYGLANHPVSKSKQYKSNIPTIAYEKYLGDELPIQEDQIKGQGVRRVSDYLNITEITQELMIPRNAYNLADQESAQYQQRKKVEHDRIARATKRAQQELRRRLEQQRAKQDAEKLSQKQFLERLVKKLNTVADHIILKGGESVGARERQLIEQRGYLDINYVAEIKVRDREAALGILDDLRILLLKHKTGYQERREDIQNQKKTGSFSVSRNSSFMNTSTATSDMGTMDKELHQEEVYLSKFCNFEALQKKWMKANIQQVKDAIRRVLATRILAHAQRQVVRSNKHKQSLDTRAAKHSAPYTTAVKALEKKGKLTAPKQKGDYQKKFIDAGDAWSAGLDVAQHRVKADWMKNNQGNSAGQMLQRQLNLYSYVRLFDTKARQCCVKFQLKETNSDMYQCPCVCHQTARHGHAHCNY